MAGGKAEFDGNFLHNITHFMDMDFIGFGDNRLTGQVVTSGHIESGLYVEAVHGEQAWWASISWITTGSAVL